MASVATQFYDRNTTADLFKIASIFLTLRQKWLARDQLPQTQTHPLEEMPGNFHDMTGTNAHRLTLNPATSKSAHLPMLVAKLASIRRDLRVIGRIQLQLGHRPAGYALQ